MIRIRRILAALATLAGALLAFIAASLAAFADHVPPPGDRSAEWPGRFPGRRPQPSGRRPRCTPSSAACPAGRLP
jgi:hypothetical protein